MNKKVVSIIGMGYVGLPLACLCVARGYKVYGIDVDQKKINLINKGVSPIKDKGLENKLKKRQINAITDFGVLKNSDIIVICVPTPVNEKYQPDFSFLISACKSVSKYLKKNHLIIIESTISPGVSRKVIKPILEKSGLKAGIDFYIAHSPERIDPGNLKWDVDNIPRVIGAISQKGLERALKFYKSILNANVKPMKSIEEAEAVKIIENTFRDINIAFVNELAKSFAELGIDVKNVIEGASTKPFAFMPHYPGCGVGGHCIPVDPYYLIEQAKQNGFDHRFLKLAREINNEMPKFTVDLIVQALNELELPVKSTSIGIMGVSYKANIDDIRGTPAFEIVDLLEKKGAKIFIYDPYIKEKSTVSNLDLLLEKSECLVLVTDHNEFKKITPNYLKQKNIKAIIDGKNCLNKEAIKKLGIIYKGIGR